MLHLAAGISVLELNFEISKRFSSNIFQFQNNLTTFQPYNFTTTIHENTIRYTGDWQWPY
jgi:hypothetical protein